MSNLPWGNGEYSVKRYRITPTDDWAETESSGNGGTLELNNPLPPPGIELMEIHRSGR